jgi:cytochrome c553
MKSKSSKLPLLIASLILVSGHGLAAEEDGETLFRQYGCITCHGAGAKDPASEIIPVIAGRSKAYIYGKAKKILLGEGETRGAKIMHEHFYSSAQCDAPPSDAVLSSIAAYIASVPKP